MRFRLNSSCIWATASTSFLATILRLRRTASAAVASAFKMALNKNLWWIIQTKCLPALSLCSSSLNNRNAAKWSNSACSFCKKQLISLVILLLSIKRRKIPFLINFMSRCLIVALLQMITLWESCISVLSASLTEQTEQIELFALKASSTRSLSATTSHLFWHWSSMKDQTSKMFWMQPNQSLLA